MKKTFWDLELGDYIWVYNKQTKELKKLKYTDMEELDIENKQYPECNLYFTFDNESTHVYIDVDKGIGDNEEFVVSTNKNLIKKYIKGKYVKYEDYHRTNDYLAKRKFKVGDVVYSWGWNRWDKMTIKEFRYFDRCNGMTMFYHDTDGYKNVQDYVCDCFKTKYETFRQTNYEFKQIIKDVYDFSIIDAKWNDICSYGITKNRYHKLNIDKNILRYTQEHLKHTKNHKKLYPRNLKELIWNVKHIQKNEWLKGINNK